MATCQDAAGALGTRGGNDALDYIIDSWQRSILFMDILRKRGNTYHEQIAGGNPPVLTFDYKIVMDGRGFERPVNFALARIMDRRSQPVLKKGNLKDRRAFQVLETTRISRSKRRPIVIIDPRAGHGPGIGGFKRDSEIGVALTLGHPVYFLLFFADPEPGQTLAEVQRCQARFVEEVNRLHPDAEKPALIGNCQGGWAAALVGADRPDITGPLVLNGSPLSYWAGVEGKNPMRYKGGLSGGAWMASLWSDLGNGKFDGANLVAGFEDLNPANTLWSKQYKVYANVDTEETRYLEFERWWNGYFYMTAEEIRFIVTNLFVGNRLEQGLLELDKHTRIDLKKIEDPVLVFASSGDNITPPQQALNWIVKVWESVDEIKRCGQVVVYLLHETIGHLGIFVSSKVSRKEHQEIIGSIDLMDYLSPGLYEMVISEGEDFVDTGDYKVRFEERQMSDILALDDGLMDEEDFRLVSAVSEFNDEAYQLFARPWVKWWVNDFTAEWLRQANPLRWSCSFFSDNNPWMAGFKAMAPLVKENRKEISRDNIFLDMEKTNAKAWAKLLDIYRNLRDETQELCFRSIYGNPFLSGFFETHIDEMNKKEAEFKKRIEEKNRQDEKKVYEEMEKGGFVQGFFRLSALLMKADRSFDQAELRYIRKLVTIHNIMTDTCEPDLKREMQNQMRLVLFDEEAALNALPKLIRRPENRLTAIQIAETLVAVDQVVTRDETHLLDRIKILLDDKKNLS